MITGLSILLIIIGLFFFLGTSVGLVRFPDFYTRMHAAGKGDTLSSLLILIGIALYLFHDPAHISSHTVLTSIKILLIGLFIFIGSPTATHIMMNAGFKSDIKPWVKKP